MNDSLALEEVGESFAPGPVFQSNRPGQLLSSGELDLVAACRCVGRQESEQSLPHQFRLTGGDRARRLAPRPAIRAREKAIGEVWALETLERWVGCRLFLFGSGS